MCVPVCDSFSIYIDWKSVGKPQQKSLDVGPLNGKIQRLFSVYNPVHCKNVLLSLLPKS